MSISMYLLSVKVAVRVVPTVSVVLTASNVRRSNQQVKHVDVTLEVSETIVGRFLFNFNYVLLFIGGCNCGSNCQCGAACICRASACCKR